MTRMEIYLATIAETEESSLSDRSMQHPLGLTLLTDGVNFSRFVFFDNSGMAQLPVNAPPPKLHYSTWWRRTARKLYQAKISCNT